MKKLNLEKIMNPVCSLLSLKSEPEHDEDIHVPLFETKHMLLGIKDSNLCSMTGKTYEDDTIKKSNRIHVFSDAIQESIKPESE